MIWLQKAWTVIWAALVVLYTTRTEWIVLYVILLLVEIFVTLAYTHRSTWRELPRTLTGYVLALIIFVAFTNAYMDLDGVELLVMGSVTMMQIDSIVTKLGQNSVAFRLWVDVKDRFKQFVAARIKEMENDERKNLPPHSVSQPEGGDTPH